MSLMCMQSMVQLLVEVVVGIMLLRDSFCVDLQFSTIHTSPCYHSERDNININMTRKYPWQLPSPPRPSLLPAYSNVQS